MSSKSSPVSVFAAVSTKLESGLLIKLLGFPVLLETCLPCLGSLSVSLTTVHVGLAQARPNDARAHSYRYRTLPRPRVILLVLPRSRRYRQLEKLVINSEH